MADDDYEIMPQKVLANIQRDIEALKKGPIGQQNKEMKDAIDRLSASIDGMLNIFKTATEQMKLEGLEANDMSKYLKPLNDKLDQILEQNETIAEGIVALSEILDKHVVNKPKLIVPKPPVPVIQGGSQPSFAQPSPSPPPSITQPFPFPSGFSNPSGPGAQPFGAGAFPGDNDADMLGPDFLPSAPPRPSKRKIRF